MGESRPHKVNRLWRPAALLHQWLGKKHKTIMSLKQAIAARKAKQDDAVRTNPEVDAKVTQFIADNPKLYEYYNEMTKEQLIRKLMLGKMQRNEYTQQRDQEIIQWVNENPEVKAKVEERIKNVPAENRQRAFVRVAKDEAMRQTMRQGQGQPPPAQGIGV
ncbi:hypothetical protein AW736_26530 [Termitidicoccus mucosus]|uniref:Uncharacterized protein n=2 Tax=Termitidicoccus mucosus TaxID=1184151 RepID=A0A178IPN9_9BACT|nr:hypothetical protein AW736_26530 [Opitutaceae bacterium TSB47]